MAQEGESIPVSAATLDAWSRAVAAGDQEAAERLLWHYHSRLVSHASRRIGVEWQGRIDAEDVVQEALVDIYKGIASFEHDGEESFYRWAAAIVSRKFIDHVRYHRRQKRNPAREIRRSGSKAARETLLERCLPNTTTPSRVMRRKDAIGAMMGYIAKLPDDYRMVIQRLYLDEAPIAEVAREMDRSEDAVRRLAGRAVEQLQRGMGHASKYLSRVS